MDFFPLDEWIESIAGLLFNIMKALVTYKKTKKELKAFFEGENFDYAENSEITGNKERNFEKLWKFIRV